MFLLHLHLPFVLCAWLFELDWRRCTDQRRFEAVGVGLSSLGPRVKFHETTTANQERKPSTGVTLAALSLTHRSSSLLVIPTAASSDRASSLPLRLVGAVELRRAAPRHNERTRSQVATAARSATRASGETMLCMLVEDGGVDVWRRAGGRGGGAFWLSLKLYLIDAPAPSRPPDLTVPRTQHTTINLRCRASR